MSDDDRLKKVLAGISASEDFDQDRWRMLPPGQETDGLHPVLREADETILPRLLNFRNDSGASIQLEVAGRRVLRISAVSGFSDITPDSPLTDVPLSGFGKSHFAGLAALLSEFMSEQGAIAVCSEISDLPRDPLDLGVWVADLAKALERPATPEQPAVSPTQVADFIGKCTKNSCTTMTFTEGETVSQDGSEKDLQMLSRVAENDLEALKNQIKKSSDAGSGTGCLVLSGSKPGNPAVVFAFSNELMGLASGATGDQFLEFWQDIA